MSGPEKVSSPGKEELVTGQSLSECLLHSTYNNPILVDLQYVASLLVVFLVKFLITQEKGESQIQMGLCMFSVKRTEEFTGIRKSWISFKIIMYLNNNNKINK